MINIVNKLNTQTDWDASTDFVSMVGLLTKDMVCPMDPLHVERHKTLVRILVQFVREILTGDIDTRIAIETVELWLEGGASRNEVLDGATLAWAVRYNISPARTDVEAAAVDAAEAAAECCLFAAGIIASGINCARECNGSARHTEHAATGYENCDEGYSDYKAIPNSLMYFSGIIRNYFPGIPPEESDDLPG